ncbi:hypothetical protein [Corynebacterium rouxii]|uniref:Uncharacterized protein n=1 Tax=Corynebacterium rouxii TaxID=2719119 RepID=A0ABU3PQ68_9CORY|nr:hypothetical protein [Corynebacterium rouxii]MDT9409728.1 hypothetical protein [Corynebacterium rouxii]MDT9411961.1 hypothetical protein [Corynebacterium rouxii]
MKPQHDNASYKRFCEAARKALEQEANQLQGCGFEQLAFLEARWHPNGFAVFHIHEDHDLGNLRLHIWPDTARVNRPGGAPIHTHAWHLCSRVLSGTYTETIYEEVNSGTGSGKRYHRGTINYLEDRNSITNSGDSLLRPAFKMKATERKYHEVLAGVPHETYISEGEFTATILITSPPILEKVHVYSPEEITPSNYHRPTLTSDEKVRLLHHLGWKTALPKGGAE